MKTTSLSLFLSTFLLLLFKISTAQTSAVLNINNVRATVDANFLFHDFANSLPSFESPVGSGSHTIYEASLWLAGKDQSGTTKTNVNTYFNSNQQIAGPIMTSSLYTAEGTNWNKVWKIQCQEIQQFVAWYDCNLNPSCDASVDFPGYQIPASILTWPAHGDISKGQAYNLAPFFDRNGDNLYDPNTGDYPLVKGDEAIFFIYNDERPFYDGNDNHSPMKTEVHGMAYAFATSDVEINNTIFLNYKIYNRSTTNYNDCFTGFWSDFDLGNYSDDFLGSDVSRSSFYVYNGDSFDDNNGGIGYGSNLPAQGVTFLKGPKQNNNGQDDAFGIGFNESINGIGFGDGIVDNEYWGLESFLRHDWSSPNLGAPVTEEHFYNYLSGKMLNGNPLSYYSTGVDCKYYYPGSSDIFNYGTNGTPQSPWSEAGVGNAPGDRVGVGSSGPFTLPSGGSIEIDLALIFGQDFTGSGPSGGVTAMQEAIDTVRSQYSRGITSNCASVVITSINDNLEESSLVIYPNPFNNAFTINYELENSTALLEVYNVIGEQIQTQTITQNSTIVNLSNQPNGFYFVTITDGTNRISKKIVKQ
tara:strand:- start:3 stop:1754 length:1752 start_codon:yes stop_codon:yes gene_type:complete